MKQSVDRDAEPDVALGRFLQAQSQAACLSAREIEQRFQHRADQEKELLEAGRDAPVDPVSGMKFSKSHLDRLYKGTASLPSRRFVTTFLEITSSTLGVQPALHRELCRKAEELLTAARRYRRNQRVQKSEASASHKPTEVAVATLQVQLELERAHRTEDRLRWALSDAQLLMTTLLQIIGTLRDIITGLDVKRIQALRDGAEVAATDAAANQRLQALGHKAQAESELARVNERRVLLETLWEQARNNVHRLSLHPDVTEIETLPAGPALPQQELLSTALLAQPALTDIAVALGKTQEINNTEERKAHQWQQDLTANPHPQPIDELATLLAATQLTDAPNREMALRTLINNWPQDPRTREALVRLTLDDQPDIRLLATLNLAQAWPGDIAARGALVAMTCDHDPRIPAIAVWGLAKAWPGDAAALDALVSLTLDRSEEAREIAVQGLGEGWPGNLVARNALLPLIEDRVKHVRETTVEVLLEGWPGDSVVRDALLTLLRTGEADVREVAAVGLSTGWPSDASVADALLALLDDDAPTVVWAAERGLTLIELAPDRYHRRAHLTRHARKAGTNASGLLIGARLPYESSTAGPKLAISMLHRGISFDPGINVISGGNGTGKSILLKALAIQVGCVGEAVKRKMRTKSPWAEGLAKDLDLLWSENPTPGECFYFGAEMHDRRRRYPLEKLLDAPVKYRLFLLDEPTALWDREAKLRLYGRMQKLAQQGCQFIIVSSDFRRAGPAGARVIRLDSRRLGERMKILGW
jgi:predicted ATPase